LLLLLLFAVAVSSLLLLLFFLASPVVGVPASSSFSCSRTIGIGGNHRR
jgi:hypothetical protein